MALATPGEAADETRDLFDEAATLYETSDYRGAVDIYTRAYRLSSSIEDEALRGQVEAAILFNLARAHSKAYLLDSSAEHLLQQVDLLEKYLAQTADLADQLEAEQLLDEARAEIAYLETVEGEAGPPPPRVEAPRQDDSRPTGRPLERAGYTLLGLGVASGGAAITGAVLAAQARDEHIAGPTADARDAAENKGTTANLMIIAGSAAAGVLVTTGVALAIAGRKRRSRVSPSAWATPTSGGLSVGGRF
jgi:tetratricopeptide (TPR) repeat protein